MRHDAEIAVTLTVAQLGRTSFTVAYEFRCGGELRARLRTVHVFLDARATFALGLDDE